jgi:hypothetical protein
VIYPSRIQIAWLEISKLWKHAFDFCGIFQLFLFKIFSKNLSPTMRISINTPKELLEEAMQLSGAKSKNELIKDAIQEKINSFRRKQLIAMKGTIDLGLDLDRLRDRK